MINLVMGESWVLHFIFNYFQLCIHSLTEASTWSCCADICCSPGRVSCAGTRCWGASCPSYWVRTRPPGSCCCCFETWEYGCPLLLLNTGSNWITRMWRSCLITSAFGSLLDHTPKSVLRHSNLFTRCCPLEVVDQLHHDEDHHHHNVLHEDGHWVLLVVVHS